MNAKQWRQLGYRTIFRNGEVSLFRPATGLTFAQPVNSGRWMDDDDVNHGRWAQRTAPDDFARIAEACYCDKGVDTCDFCAGVRHPDHGGINVAPLFGM